MRKIVVGSIFLLITNILSAQMNPNRGGGQQMTGSFYGKILDSITGKPIDAASVQLIQSKYDSVDKKRKDVTIGGMLTKSNGDFNIPGVPLMGQYKLKISAIGFKPYETTVALIDMNAMRNRNAAPGGQDMSAMLGNIDKDLGNIKLVIDQLVLGNVTVSAALPLVQLGIDRKIFNVDRNLVSAGGTGVDVMRNVPLLNVDIDGNVTLRNNAPQIFVDGRPTTLTLDQIPADAIQSVEIITNPSAKFDASGGTAGILNIVLKKEKKVGYNGNLRFNIDSRARIGLGADVNVRQQKVNFFVATNYNQRKSISKGTTERTTFLDSTTTHFIQKDRSTMLGNFGFARAGLDFFVDNRNTITVTGTFVKGKFKPSTVSDLYYDTLYTPRTSQTTGEFRNIGSQLSFKHNFPKNGMELTADATYNRSKNDNSNHIRTDYYKLPQNTYDSTYSQVQKSNGMNQNLVLQADYSNPINDKSKFETGLRAQLRSNNNTSAFYRVDEITGQLNLDTASQINYESDDRILAAYATYSNQLKTFGYQLGLRMESSNYKGKLTKTGELFNIDFPIGFFPSVFLSKKITEDQDLQLNYSRRINRPNFWQLTPFTDSSDFLNRSKGNPGLKPEFTNSIELTYSKIFKNKDNLLLTAYYKNTNDLISRFQVIEQEPVTGKNIILNTYINANSSYVTGLELINKNKLTKWWDLTSNFNLFTSKIDINNPGQPDPDQFVSWFAKINNSFKLPHNISIQLSGDYQSKTVLPPGGSGGGGRGGFGGMGFGQATSSQGYVRPSYGVDLAMRYEFLKNRAASISMNINDIFKTRISDVHSESSFFIQDVQRRRDAQVVRLNFNWRFGKFDASLFKRKNTKGENMNSMPDNVNF